jgi:hypothetical protein
MRFITTVVALAAASISAVQACGVPEGAWWCSDDKRAIVRSNPDTDVREVD